MRTLGTFRTIAISWIAFVQLATAATTDTASLPATKPLTVTGDLSAQMVEGIDRFLLRELERSQQTRSNAWQRDFSSAAAYVQSIATNRHHLRTLLGAVDEVTTEPVVELIATTATSDVVARTPRFTVRAVRWNAFGSVTAEGLLVEPIDPPTACVVVLPDADQTPEALLGIGTNTVGKSAWARHLAEAGCELLIPTLISREDTWSGNEVIGRFTNFPHREWIWRQAFECGRHIIGYEVEKVQAALTWFQQHQPRAKLGVAGYAEGGSIALYAAALDPRVEATLVSGYFGSRQNIWAEPIYRDVFGFLREFGDAELASLIAPRSLVIEYSETPTIQGPPPSRSGRSGASAGKWATPDFNATEVEVNRAQAWAKPLRARLEFIYGNEGMTLGPGSELALRAFLAQLGIRPGNFSEGSEKLADARGERALPEVRQKRQVNELVAHTQSLLRYSDRRRDDFFWKKISAKTATDWAEERGPWQAKLWDDLIGRFPRATEPMNPRSRQIYDREKWVGHEVMLDVFPDVYAWGILLVPKDLKPGERRPVVVCQHGLEGVPNDTITENPKENAFGYYQAFAARLAERGFIVFSPHNPYRGNEKFRVLQRKAHPLKTSLFSIILAQHDRILDWLETLPYVDPQRIGFYGLSYGGKTAMRVPSLLPRYCLSICSADFNEWAKKCASIEAGYSYLYNNEYDMYEFNLAHTFNYAEMAALIAPRPFMVERGHHDGVAPDEWVAQEYSRVRRFYARLGIPEKTEIEFFNGPHQIHGQGTYRFLHRHLNWPEPAPAKLTPPQP